MLLAALLIPFVTATLAAALPWRRAVEGANLAGATLLAGVATGLAAVGPRRPFPGEIFRVDALAALVLALVAWVALAAAFYSIRYMGAEVDRGEVNLRALRAYYGLFHLFVFTMVAAALADNLAVFWIAIEATTLVSALLVGFYRNRQSVEAAWKYIILCTVSISFALLGIFLIYHASVRATGGDGTLAWSALSRIGDRLDPKTMSVAFVFIVVGYGAKAGLAPLHNWLPDAHSQAPTPVSALLSAVLLKCAMLGVLRVAALGAASPWGATAAAVLLTLGLLSMALAAFFILMQNNYKRLLAYSSIEHLGVIAVGAGLGGFLGFYGALLHMVNHAVVKTLLFLTTGELRLRYGSTKIDRIRGVLRTLPLAGPVMLLAAFAIAGSPPFNIFLSEFTVLRAAAGGGRWFVLGVMLLLLTVIFGGVLRHFGTMAFGPSEESDSGRRVPGASWIALVVFAGLTAAMLTLGLYVPGPLHALVSSAARVAGGGLP